MLYDTFGVHQKEKTPNPASIPNAIQILNKIVDDQADCHGTAPNEGNLELWKCGDVDICGLSQTFTQLCWLRVYNGNRLVYSDDWRSLHRRKTLSHCGWLAVVGRSFVDDCSTNVKVITKKQTPTNGPDGTISNKTLTSTHTVLQGAHKAAEIHSSHQPIIH